MIILLVSLYFTPVDMNNDTPTKVARNFTTTAECESYKAQITPALNHALEEGLIGYAATCQSK
jgi:hypothetical protein